MTDQESLETLRHMGLDPDNEQIARRIVQRDFGWIWELSGEQVEALWSGIRDGYLMWPVAAGVSLRAVYLMDRKFRGRTGVVLWPSREARGKISAYCFGPGPWPQLQMAAERVGVEVGVARPEAGLLSGWIDAGPAEDAARQLMVLRTGPDMLARRRCRQRRPVGDGVR